MGQDTEKISREKGSNFNKRYKNICYAGRRIFFRQKIEGDYCYLYERLPRVGGDHGLELAGGEGVDVAGL